MDVSVQPHCYLALDELGVEPAKEKVYEIASNLSYRLEINKDASSMDFENERVNRNGLVHDCVIKNVNYNIQTISNDFGDNKLVYGELIENIYAIRKSYSYMIFEVCSPLTE